MNKIEKFKIELHPEVSIGPFKSPAMFTVVVEYDGVEYGNAMNADPDWTFEQVLTLCQQVIHSIP